jgi:Helix-turn-helix domain
MPSTETKEETALAAALGELRDWLLAPGRMEQSLGFTHDTFGARLPGLRDELPADVLDHLADTRRAPDPDRERAFLGHLLDQLGDPPTPEALAASLPYIGRALRCREEAEKREPEKAAWLVNDLQEALGWAAEAQDTAAGEMTAADFEDAQARDQFFGFFLGKPGAVKHPKVIGGTERSRAFRWYRWSRRLGEREYLSRAAKQVAWLLADFADAKGECWPSQAQLAELSGMSKKGVREGIRELERDVALTIAQDASGRGPTRYRLLAVEVTPMAVSIARNGRGGEPEVPF